MRIDIHSHLQYLDFVQHLHNRSGTPTSVLERGMYTVHCGPGVSVPSVPKLLDVEDKLRDMDAMRIDIAVLSHGLPLGPDTLGGAEADSWAAAINDHLARIVAAHPDRFLAFGSLGFGDVQRCIAEVDRCLDQPGFKGFQLFSNVAGGLLDTPEVLAVVKHIGERGVPVHLHPAVPLNRVGLERASLAFPLGFPFDTSLGVLRLIHSGLFDEVPELAVIVAHAGGVLPYLTGRLATYSVASPVIPDAPDLQQPVGHYLSRLYVDTVCYDANPLGCCHGVIGPNRMLFGTDHPFGGYLVAANTVDELVLTGCARELIYHVNAERLLRLKRD